MSRGLDDLAGIFDQLRLVLAPLAPERDLVRHTVDCELQQPVRPALERRVDQLVVIARRER